MKALFAAAALAWAATQAAALEGVAAQPGAEPAAAGLDPAVQAYASTQIGRFSNQAQASADPRYALVEVRVVRLWPERTDGLWLYQEQALMAVDASDEERSRARAQPYFQRVSRVVRLADGSLRRDNYPLVEPLRFVGLGQMPGPADLGPAGCHNRIETPGGAAFVARTEDCANSHRGAQTMTSLSIAWPGTVINWDRGWSAEGRQVWGPVDGGYVFKRLGD